METARLGFDKKPGRRILASENVDYPHKDKWES
jgi:hypothetical protein